MVFRMNRHVFTVIDETVYVYGACKLSWSGIEISYANVDTCLQLAGAITKGTNCP